MDNLDEKIIALRNQNLKKQNSNIETGVYINNTLVEFAEQSVLDDQFTILIPSCFEEMSPEDARLKYPSEQRPQHIVTTQDTSVNLCISLLDVPASNDQTPQNVLEMKSILKMTNPATEFFESGLEALEDFDLAWFEYKSFAIDGQIYNIMFTASAYDKMLHGAFNCTFGHQDAWRDPALQMLKSIKLSKKGGNNNA